MNVMRTSFRGTAPRLLVAIITAAPALGAAFAAMAQAVAPAAPPRTAEAAGPTLEEVTVTATRRVEALSKVPISVSTFGVDQMDERGVRQFDDLVRLSPGLNLTRQGATGANQIAIRGIASDAGSGTTGVYIDDTPIQVRNLGFGASNAFPGLFDIERVEVLRGPQGTLFGAGSEGGTIRFITTEPRLTGTSGYARAEVASPDIGSLTYEGGAAFGTAIIPEHLAVRASVFYRREGGYIDLVNGTYNIVDPTGALYDKSVQFTRTSTLSTDVNWNRTIAARLALKFQPFEGLSITPSLFWQKHYLNDGASDSFDLALSSGHHFARQGYEIAPAGTTYSVANVNGAPVVLNAMDAPNNAFGDDRFKLSAIAVSWDLGAVQLASNTSYFDRHAVQWYDYTKGYVSYYVPQFFVNPDGSPRGDYAPLGWKNMALYDNSQANFVQELRLQSSDDKARLTWLVGAFYAHNHQTADEPISSNYLLNSPWVGFYPSMWGYGYYGVTGGDPFGPGHTAAQNFWGADLLPNGVTFFGAWRAVERQAAGFAQADFRIVQSLKLTAGVRYSSNKLDFDARYLGPENNANAPFGFPCPTGPVCPYGSGVLAPAYPTSASHSSETAVTPKIGLSFEPSDTNLFYATASKGFRPAGASLRVPAICDSDLITNGYVDANGKPIQPTTYKSDSVWSYELGSKNRLFNGRLVLDGSVYLIKWKSIQTNVELTSCAYNFVDNLADATSKGFDLAFQALVTDHLEVDGAYGYNNPSFDRDARSPGGTVIYHGGTSIPNAGPPQTLSLTTEYTVPFGAARKGYARADFTYTSRWRRYGATEPGTPNYDPLLHPIAGYGVLNLRFGARYTSGLDISAFIQNATDRAPSIADPAFTHSTYYDPQDWSSITLRPRTYGVTATWRY